MTHYCDFLKNCRLCKSENLHLFNTNNGGIPALLVMPELRVHYYYLCLVYNFFKKFPPECNIR